MRGQDGSSFCSLVWSGLPWWLSGKESTCQCRRHRFDSWVRNIPGRRQWQPTPVFLPGGSPWAGEPGGLWSVESQSQTQVSTAAQHLVSSDPGSPFYRASLDLLSVNPSLPASTLLTVSCVPFSSQDCDVLKLRFLTVHLSDTDTVKAQFRLFSRLMNGSLKCFL